MKSFTDWIRSMKRLPQDPEETMNEVEQHSIRRIADVSVEEKEILTESMAEVWVKQGNYEKARQIYRKLSLQNPSKSSYFAAKIEQLKVL
ncbi:MAG: tetratricopeptide repeat protein [Chitinophagaceae bacterium]|nr:MAG: tetratricopeptide repeat protein [Chitinophagaceae bacterium]